MKSPVAPESMRALMDKISWVSVVTISTWMSRELAKGVEAITYFCGSLRSQQGRQIREEGWVLGVGCTSKPAIISSYELGEVARLSSTKYTLRTE
jgi:hypothetical protein